MWTAIGGIAGVVGSIAGVLALVAVARGQETTDTRAQVELEQKVATLAEQVELLQQLPHQPLETAEGGIPPGAVVAFATTCPTTGDWSPYEAAACRFLLGVGQGPLKAFVGLGAPGGEEEVALDGRNMAQMAATTFRHANDSKHRAFTPDKETELGRPHNNMPRYIALHFCEKS